MRKTDARRKSGPSTAAQPWHSFAAAALIAIVAGVVYSNSFDAPFLFDGEWLIRDPQMIKQIWPWKMSFGQNRPLGMLSFGLNYAAGGYDVWGYHVVNFVVHVAAACALFGIVRRTLSGSRLGTRYGQAAWPIALVAALIWVAHPLQTESVTYIYQRLESLMALFYLLTLYCFIRAQESSRQGWWYAAAVACCGLGMGTKEITVTAPLLVLWYDRVFVARGWREIFSQRATFYLALFGTWAILLGLIIANAAAYADVTYKHVGALEYALTQPAVILHYLRLSFWPNALSLDYGWEVARHWNDILPPLTVLAVLLAGTLVCMPWRPAVGFILGSFFLILGPTSSIAPIIDLAFEHRMYLPLASVVIAAVLAVYEAGKTLAMPTAAASNRAAPVVLSGALAIAVISALGARTYFRNNDYSSSLTMWENTVRTRPDNPRSWVHRGHAYLQLAKKGDHPALLKQAIEDFSKAIELKPDMLRAFENRGCAYQELRQFELALADFNRAIELKPELTPTSFRGRAMIYQMMQNRLPEAIADYTNSITYKYVPLAEAYNSRATAYALLPDLDRALADVNEALRLDPDFADAYVNRGTLYRKIRQPDLAARDHDEAIRLAPDSAQAYSARGSFYKSQKRWGSAIADFSTLIALEPRNPLGYLERAICLHLSNDPGATQRAWADVATCRALGKEPPAPFLEALTKASQ